MLAEIPLLLTETLDFESRDFNGSLYVDELSR
jgi:hypothetical protein